LVGLSSFPQMVGGVHNFAFLVNNPELFLININKIMAYAERQIIKFSAPKKI